ncbi:DUF1801 domain-containing protein [Pontibacter sp. JH31]|uniref:DUF1801 domain-containing protein n=2 Tax=Pontibacter aquaedesilientis TaxID=2766980 RepID=A0ABR7XHU3_9BACT|nr:DUF1801 domain-containing protein [Pontibacter aquaedesilientis]
MHPQITEYIICSEKHKETLAALRELVHDSVPGLTEDFKWGRPVFRTQNNFAYLKSAKAYVTVGFFNFGKLHDPQNLLEGTGKEMRHIKIKNVSDIDSNLLKEWFKSAAV